MNKTGIIYILAGLLLLSNCTTTKQVIYTDFYKASTAYDSTLLFATQGDSITILIATNDKNPILLSNKIPSWVSIKQDTLPHHLVAFTIYVSNNSENIPRHTMLDIGKKTLSLLQSAHTHLAHFIHYHPLSTTITLTLQKDTHQLILHNLPIHQEGSILYHNQDTLLEAYRITSAIFKDEKNTAIDWWNYQEGIPIGKSIDIKDSMFLFAGGNGSLRLPYLIANPLQLDAVRTKGCNPNYVVYFKQIKDIDLSDAIGIKALINKERQIQFVYQNAYAVFNHQASGWIPIGNDELPFTGHYHGNDYNINGLYIQNTTLNQIGLFGKINPTATIEHLSIGSNSLLYNHYNYEDTAITYTNMGSIAGENNGTIIACTSNAHLYSEDENNTGGIVGFNYGIVAGCTAKNILLNSYIGGGIAGFNYGNISSCRSNLNTIIGYIIGGIAGYNSNVISGCLNDKNNIATSVHGGNIAGYNSNTMIACYAINCNLQKNNIDANIGLLSGYNNLSGDIIGCYNNSTQNDIPLIGDNQNEKTTFIYNLTQMTDKELFNALFEIPYQDFQFFNTNGTTYTGNIIWKNSIENYPILWWE